MHREIATCGISAHGSCLSAAGFPVRWTALKSTPHYEFAPSYKWHYADSSFSLQKKKPTASGWPQIQNSILGAGKNAASSISTSVHSLIGIITSSGWACHKAGKLGWWAVWCRGIICVQTIAEGPPTPKPMTNTQERLPGRRQTKKSHSAILHESKAIQRSSNCFYSPKHDHEISPTSETGKRSFLHRDNDRPRAHWNIFSPFLHRLRRK